MSRRAPWLVALLLLVAASAGCSDDDAAVGRRHRPHHHDGIAALAGAGGRRGPLRAGRGPGARRARRRHRRAGGRGRRRRRQRAPGAVPLGVARRRRHRRQRDHRRAHRRGARRRPPRARRGPTAPPASPTSARRARTRRRPGSASPSRSSSAAWCSPPPTTRASARPAATRTSWARARAAAPSTSCGRAPEPRGPHRGVEHRRRVGPLAGRPRRPVRQPDRRGLGARPRRRRHRRRRAALAAPADRGRPCATARTASTSAWRRRAGRRPTRRPIPSLVLSPLGVDTLDLVDEGCTEELASAWSDVPYEDLVTAEPKRRRAVDDAARGERPWLRGRRVTDPHHPRGERRADPARQLAAAARPACAASVRSWSVARTPTRPTPA